MTPLAASSARASDRGGRRRPRKRRSVPLALGIYSTVMAFLTALPLLILVPVSLNPKPMVGLPDSGISFEWYANVFTNTSFPEAFLSSAVIAVSATTISLIVGSLAAWALTRSRFRGSSLVQGFLLSPLLLARIVYGVAMLIALTQLGLIRTTLGLVLAHSVIVVPYVVRIVGSTLLGIQSSLEEASAVLGAGQVRTFLRITLPLLTPGLIAATVFGFITSFDEFTMSVFLVGPRTKTLPVEIFKYAELVVDPSVAAVSVILVVGALIGVFALERTMGLQKVLRA